MEIVKQREIQHEFHEHPLVWVEEQSNQLSEKANCYGCGEVVLGPCFSCSECNNFQLHQKCAEAPFDILPSSLHRRHDYGFFIRERPAEDTWYACALCKEKRDMFFYECNVGDFSIDIKCAFLISQNLDENFRDQFKDDSIQHQFIFLENLKDELKKVNCSLCHESLVDSFYVSTDCKFHLHKKCFESSFEIDHPCHRIHFLILEFSEKKCFCKLCQEEDDYNFFYRCLTCKFDIHAECAWSKPIVKNERYHEHPFTLLWKQDPFICNGCGIEGNCLCYICTTCHLLLHKHCTSLPRIVKSTRHKHFLHHKYFLKKREFEKHECQICLDEVKAEHGVYLCLKEDCNYIAHVNCATENNDLYYEVDLQNDVEEPDDEEPSICVIEKNEGGEATIVKHFYHDPHNLNLVLEDDKMININGRNCDGCVLSISIPFYYCSECNFYLHKTCAELPKSKHHWFHRYVATLQAKDMIRCALCNRYCSGLFYKSSKGNYYDAFYFCLRCAMVPNVIKCEGHKHLLFFDYKCKMQCNGCGVRSKYGAFRCKECNFAVDFACLTLPHEIQHKCDEHLLQLTYDHDENADDDDDQNYCYICEEKREPISHWYYHCSTSTCNTSAHTQCVLGKFPFIKDGITWPSRSYMKTHPHSRWHELTFVQDVDGYPKCDRCDKLCQDQTLKCSECNYFLHCKCLKPRVRTLFDCIEVGCKQLYICF